MFFEYLSINVHEWVTFELDTRHLHNLFVKAQSYVEPVVLKLLRCGCGHAIVSRHCDWPQTKPNVGGQDCAFAYLSCVVYSDSWSTCFQ
jgi:hypothetical protein